MNKHERLIDVRETRALATPLEMRDAAASGHIVLEGYASTFEPYDVFGGPAGGGWVEQLDRRAFDKTLDAKPDVQLLVNHEGWPLARTKSGTLELSVDDRGLKVRAMLDRSDPDVQRLLPKMTRGDMDEMSFAFRVLEQDWDRSYTHRTIHEVNLQKGDVSVVNYGANPTTSAALAETFDALAALPKRELAEIRSRLGLPAEPTRVGTTLQEHPSREPATDVAAALRQHGLAAPKPVQRSTSTTTATPRALADIPDLPMLTRVPIDPRSDKHLVYQRGSALHPYGGEKRSSWIADLLKAKCGMDSDGECRKRLVKHAQQVKTDPAFAEWRDISTVDGEGGFGVPPKYLIDSYVLIARAGRAFADCTTNEILPSGTDSVNLPAATQGTAAAIQTDNTEVIDVDIADTLISAPVVTIAGSIGVSIELLEQSPVDFSAIVFRDLIAAHATQTDLQVIAGTGESGQMLGVDNTPNVQSVEAATTDIPGFFNALAKALFLINSTRFEPPEVIVLSPVRWSWICSLLDSEDRPLLLPYANSANNIAAVLQKVAPERIVGQLMGLPVVLDTSVTTVDGSDTVYIMRGSDLVLWESPFKLRVSNEVKAPNLTVLLTAWNYSAFLTRYTSSVVRVTGLAAPDFG